MGPTRKTSDAEKPASAEGNSRPPDEAWGWTRRQRMGLGLLLALLVVFLAVQFVRRAARLDDPVVTYDGATVTLPARVDPNTATEAELTRIPHLGEKIAAKMIAYRTQRREQAGDGIVFREPEDLGHVPGVGKATVEQLRPYLQFPEDAETQPAAAP